MIGELRARLSGARGRRVVLGLTDQAVIALANAGNALLATAVLPRSAAGSLMVSLATVYFIMGVNRAFVGEVLLAHVSRFEGEDRYRQERNALATALTMGVLGSVVLLGLWAFGSPAAFGYLIWAVPFMPVLLLHDTGRYTYLARRQQGNALVIDLTWVSIQAATVTGLLLAGWRDGGALLVAWGLGATGGAALFLARTRLDPLRGRPRQWVRETRHLSGWFTATALIGQSQAQLVAFLVAGLLRPTAYAGLRLAQLVVLQPVQNFVQAMMGLLVPRFSRLAAASRVGAVRRDVRLMTAVGAVCGAVVVLVAVTFARPVLDWYRGGQYADVSGIALPVAIQAGIYLMQIPYAAAMRGMQQARMLFGQYAAFTATSLTGLVIGARTAQLRGAAWGLTIGAAVGFAVMVALYAFATRRFAAGTAAGAERAPAPEAPTSGLPAEPSHAPERA